MPSFTELVRQQMGADIKSLDPETGVAVFNVNGEDVEVDSRGMKQELAASLGINANDISDSSAEEPIRDSALSFMEQIRFADAKTDKDKYNYLVSQYGESNVKVTKQGISVNDNGVWKQGDIGDGVKGFLARTISEVPAIAGGSIGAKIGAGVGGTAGSIIPGAGTALGAGIGAVVGAGIGTALGKITDIAAAYGDGIRTEADAADIAKEVGTEALIGMAGEGVIRGGIAAGSQLAKVYGKIGKVANTPEAKYEAANLINKITKGDANGVADNLMWMEDPAKANIAYNKSKQWMMKGRQVGEAHPVEMEIGQKISEAANTAKATMMEEYGAELSKLGPKLKTAQVNMTEIIPDVEGMYKQWGFIDESGNWLKNSDREIALSAKPKTVNALKSIYSTLKKGGKSTDGVLDIEKAQQLVRNIDEIMEPSMADAISSVGKSALVKVRQTMQNSIMDSIKKVDPEAAVKYGEIRSKYGNLRNWLDDILIDSAPDKIQKLTARIVNPNKGSIERDYMRKALQHTGVDADAFINDIMTSRAGMNKAAESSDFLRTPRMAARALDGYSKMLPKQPLSNKSFVELKTRGKVSEFLTSLPSKAKQSVLNNPAIMQSLSQMIDESGSQYDQQLQGLIEQGMGAANGR